MPVKHLKVSAKADGPDPGNVHASDWNAVHDLSALVAGDVADFAEAVDDRVALLLKQGANITLTYDDVGNTLTIASTASGGNLTTVADTAPASPAYGDRWIKPSNGSEMVWVPNAGTPGVWLNPVDAAVALQVAYPIAINKGGTGATDAPTALVNLGGTTVGIGVFTAATAAAARTVLGATPVGIGALPIDGSGSMTGVLKLADGTVNAPGLAFASEPGLGWYRSGASILGLATQGQVTSTLDAGSPTNTIAAYYPRTGAAGSRSWLYLSSQPKGAANFNACTIFSDPAAGVWIQTSAGGTATRGNLTLDAPGVGITGSLSVAANITANGGYLALTGAASSYLNINKTASGGYTYIGTFTGNVQRWQMLIGDSTAESGGNAGSNFQIIAFNDAGSFICAPMQISRATGVVSVQATNNQSAGLIVWDAGTTGGSMKLGGPGGSKILRCANDNSFQIINNANTQVLFMVDEQARVTSYFGYRCIRGNNGTVGPNSFNFYWPGNGSVECWVDTSNIGQIQMQSDERIKHSIAALPSMHDAFMQIVPISFRFKEQGIYLDDGIDKWGFSAQNLLSLVPKAVEGSITAVDKDGNPRAALVIDRPLLALTILEVQNIWTTVNALNDRLSKLETLQ